MTTVRVYFWCAFASVADGLWEASVTLCRFTARQIMRAEMDRELNGEVSDGER